MAELHQIEEGRHIYFAKKYLADFTNGAGIIKRSIYCMIMALHVHFMITMYVKKEIFERVGLKNAGKICKMAKENYRNKFSARCLTPVIEFVDGFNGFNPVTKAFWKWLLHAHIS